MHIRRLVGVVLGAAAIAMLVSRPASGAVTEVSVAKGHHLHGVRQKLFKNAKLAPGHPLSGDCMSAPTEADKGRLEAGNFVHKGGGMYSLDLYAHDSASEGTYVMRFYDHSTAKTAGGMKALDADLTVYVKEIIVLSVSFLEGSTPGLGIRVAQDPQDRVISAPEWWNGVRNDPGAYVRSTGTKQIKVKLNGPANYSCSIDANGDWGGIQSKTVTFDGNGVYWSSSFVVGSAAPSVVGLHNVGWQWRFTKDGQTRNINASSHKIYVVFADNSGCATRYQTLYEFGCDWAQGQSTEAGTFSAVWNKVSDRSSLGYSYWPLPLDPLELPPFGLPPRANYMPRVFWARELILEGIGRCGAFAGLFVNLMEVQGISVDDVGLTTDRTTWWWLLTDASAQGGTPQQAIFPDHAIVRHDNYFDPSYGIPGSSSGFGSVLAWEDAAVDQYSPVPIDATQYPPQAWSADTKGLQEVVVVQ